MEKQNKRYIDSLASRFKDDDFAEALIMKAPSDIGVRRNGGRNGARFAPEAIENCLKKMNNHLSYASFLSREVSRQSDEKVDYQGAIQKSSKVIEALLAPARKAAIHLGGGHDHALALLRALDNSESQNILVVNFDAHCDTRIDDRPHSGTPFRDFDAEASKPFHLVQVGIHDFANSPETLTPLKNNSEKIFFSRDLDQIKEQASFVDAIFASCPFEVSTKTDLFISIDCDAISSSVMSAVSAVNHNGLDPVQLLRWMQVLKDFPCERKVLGLYEYNPVFEDLSQKGARFLAGLIYEYLSS